MRTYDYTRTSHIRKNGIHMRLTTLGLMHSKIFVEYYEPMDTSITNTQGCNPYYETFLHAIEGDYFVTFPLPKSFSPYIFYDSSKSIEELDREARTHHNKIFAYVKQQYRSHWEESCHYYKKRGEKLRLS